MWLFLIFVAVPILEIALFIEVGGLIGLWPTLLIVVLTALAGTLLVRHQGLQVLDQLRRSLEQGGDPVGPIAHGALILVAGVLLLTPGFFTDTLGLALLVPPLRSRLIAAGAARVTLHAAGTMRGGRRGPPPAGDTIETEYEVIEPENQARRGDSGWTRP